MHALHARDAFGDDDAFVHRLVREPGRPGEIADRPNTGDAGFAPWVDDDMGPVDLYARRFEPDILDIADNAHGEDNAVHRDRLKSCRPWSLSVAVTLSAPFSNLVTEVPVFKLHALFRERLGGEGGDILILHRKYAVQHLDHP